MIARIPADRIAAAWPDLAPLMRRGLAQTAHTVDEATLRAALLADRLQLWADLGAPVVAVTMVADYPNLRVLSVLLLAGRGMRHWLAELERCLDIFGRAEGCAALEALVRPGLAGARYNPARAALATWHAEKTLMRRPIPVLSSPLQSGSDMV